MSATMRLERVVKEFSSEPAVRPLDGLDLSVGPGELVCVTGVSGRGKSTLLNVMGGLLRPDSGRVLFKGEDLYAAGRARLDELHRRGIGFVFQTPFLLGALTARENLEMAFRAAKVPLDRGAVERELELFGLAERAGHLPCELSVGQRRRLVMARAMLAGHDLVLADEPTNDLDADWSDYVFGRLADIAATGGRSVVVVTHDEEYARRADTVYVLENGVLSRRHG